MSFSEYISYLSEGLISKFHVLWGVTDSEEAKKLES